MVVRPIQAVVGALVVVASSACSTVRSHASDNAATRDSARMVSTLRAADSLAILRDIAWLASDAREGRGTGTAGFDSAAVFVARRYATLGLNPVSGSGERAFLQAFTARPAARSHGAAITLPTFNIVAVLPGTDAQLRNEYVVVGAHLDHLGREPMFARDPDAKDAIRNGADDNASGTAAVLELARLFKRAPAKRSIVFVNFSAEEYGLLGARAFIESAAIPTTNMVAMVNFDMVGRLKDERLIVYGVETAKEMRGIVDSASAGLGFRLSAQGDGAGPSDHASFYEAGMPVLHFFTDLHDDYHSATDDVERINAGGTARVVTMAERVVRNIANRPSRLDFVRVQAAPATASSRSGSDVYLGSVPDMAAGDTPGMRLTGVREGSPAALGGLKAGDVIVEFGGVKVTDLYTYTDALYSKKPGDKVKIVVMRNGERLTLEVTLGKRGS